MISKDIRQFSNTNLFNLLEILKFQINCLVAHLSRFHKSRMRAGEAENRRKNWMQESDVGGAP